MYPAEDPETPDREERNPIMPILGTIEERREQGEYPAREEHPAGKRYHRRMIHVGQRFMPRIEPETGTTSGTGLGRGSIEFTAASQREATETARAGRERVLTEASIAIDDPLIVDGGSSYSLLDDIRFTPEASRRLRDFAPTFYTVVDVPRIMKTLASHGDDDEWTLRDLRELYGPSGSQQRLLKMVELVTGHDGIIERGAGDDTAIVWNDDAIYNISHPNPKYRDRPYPSTISDWYADTVLAPAADMTPADWKWYWTIPNELLDDPKAPFDTGTAARPTATGVAPAAAPLRETIGHAIERAIGEYGYRRRELTVDGYWKLGLHEYGGFLVRPGEYAYLDTEYSLTGLQYAAFTLATICHAGARAQIPGAPTLQELDDAKDQGRVLGDMILEAYGLVESGDPDPWARVAAADLIRYHVEPQLPADPWRDIILDRPVGVSDWLARRDSYMSRHGETDPWKRFAIGHDGNRNGPTIPVPTDPWRPSGDGPDPMDTGTTDDPLTPPDPTATAAAPTVGESGPSID